MKSSVRKKNLFSNKKYAKKLRNIKTESAKQNSTISKYCK